MKSWFCVSRQAGGWEFSWRREPLVLGFPPGSPQTPGAGAYLENSQGKKNLAPEVFVLKSYTLRWLLGFWGSFHGLRALCSRLFS